MNRLVITDTAPPESCRKKIRVLLVGNHMMLRERLVELIGGQPDMDVCGEVADLREGIEMIYEQSPDLAVVDTSSRVSGEFELLEEIHHAALLVPVIVLSIVDDAAYAERILRAGAKGYVSKTESSAEFLGALRKVLGCEVYVNERLASELIKRMAAGETNPKESAVDALAGREREVFRLIGEGKNTHDIARQLNIRESTVATVRTRIKGKIGVKDVPELYHRATEWMQAQQRAA